MAQRGAKGLFPRQSNPVRHTRPQNQGYKVEVNEVTPRRNKAPSETSAPLSKYKFYIVHQLESHETDECPNVRATIDRMVENRYWPTGKSQSGQPSQLCTINYTYN
ncbi:Uncharacterized protein Fot_28757 [Forsythia ovata]|uniref:Uncharacterized protein n=1 Tax=Forsythia ovata TaxID=205694 RepID=A0ABD1TPW7_9LAMI